MIPIRDTAPCHSTPIITYSLIGICSFIFIMMLLIPDALSHQWITQFGMVSLRYSNGLSGYMGYPFDGYLSFITHLFLHANWQHILINMWFLWIFADTIEDSMGHISFSIFYIICGVLSALFQWYATPHLAVPLVGASGAIAGVLGAYFYTHPMARVIVWFPPLFVFHIPAIAFLGGWVILQLNDATTAALFGETANTAWWAHLGGFIAGGFLHPLFLKSTKLNEETIE